MPACRPGTALRQVSEANRCQNAETGTSKNRAMALTEV
jgi:hypothetical protein